MLLLKIGTSDCHRMSMLIFLTEKVFDLMPCLTGVCLPVLDSCLHLVHSLILFYDHMSQNVGFRCEAKMWESEFGKHSSKLKPTTVVFKAFNFFFKSFIEA